MITSSTSPDTLIDEARNQGRTVLYEHEGYQLLDSVGIRTPAHQFVARGTPPAAPGFEHLRSERLVLKIVSTDITHKSDVGGVRIVRNDPTSIAAEIDDLLVTVQRAAPEAKLHGVLVVEAVDFPINVPGVEFLLSLRRDPAFGTLLVFGLGGLMTEWYGALSSASTIVWPTDHLDPEAAVAAIERTPMGAVALHPSRIHERAPVDRTELGATLERLASLADVVPPSGIWIEEIEINPVVAVDGTLQVLDAVVRLGTPTEAPRPPRPIATIAHLLHPRSVAVFGASTRGLNAGRIVLRSLKQTGAQKYGHLYAVHPTAEDIDGIPCYRSAATLPETVDMAVVAVPAERAADVIESVVAEGRARSIILIPGGFAETGEGDRAKRVETLLTSSRQRPDGGPVMVGGNCLGIVSKGEYNTFFLPSYKLPFNDAPGESLVAISQSGAYLVSLTSNLDGIIFPRASISYGNEMDLTAADFLEYYLEHETEARVFSCYIEGFQPGEGQRFARLVRRATDLGRPVVVYKAGKTASGARAALTHTASLVGDYAIAHSCLEASGALVTETLNMLEDYTKAFTMLSERDIRGRRLGVVSNAGFEAGAVSDHLYGLELAEFSPATTALLREVLPDIAHLGNPIDTTPMARTEHFTAAVEAMAGDPGVDMLIVSAIPATPALEVLAPDLAGSHSENIFAMGSLPAELVRILRATAKPLVVAIDSGRLYDPTVHYLQRAGIPVYRKIDRASRALSAVAGFHLDRKGASG